MDNSKILQLDISTYETLQIELDKPKQPKKEQTSNQPINELLEQNKRLRDRLWICEQSNQNLMKDVQMKKQQITYLSAKSFDFAKEYLDIYKKNQEREQTSQYSLTESTRSIHKEGENEMKKILDKLDKQKARVQKLKKQRIILKNQLQNKDLTIESLKEQLRKEQSKKQHQIKRDKIEKGNFQKKKKQQ